MTKKEMFDYFLNAGYTPEGVAGLMGNLRAESALNPINLQNSGEKRIGMTDAEYTVAVDSGAYTKFTTDSIGYGLAQWTSSGRKAALLAFAKEKGKSIGDAGMQIEFIVHEMSTSYKNVEKVLKSAKTVKEASDVVVKKYERPANQSEGILNKRAEYGMSIYEECMKGGSNMGRYASEVVKQAKAWIGKKESDGSHKEIIDIYNAHRPLARNYKVKYTDSWCATFVSAVAIKLGYTDIIPTECSCQKMIELMTKMGIWFENDDRTPKAGEIIFYDWEDKTGTNGENAGWSDHVGIVEKVSGGKITVIEGNYSNSVKRRTIDVNGKYIRGYGVPAYETEPNKVAASNAVATKKASRVMEWQNAAIKDGFVSKYGADGCWGPECETIAKNAIVKKRLIAKYKNLTKIVQREVGVKVDGICGKDTKAAIEDYQRKNGLVADGCVGLNTWKKILGI